MIDLKNKLILVTGSGAGVGSGIAITFAKCGADLVIHYNRSEKEAEKTKEKIISLGRRCKLIKSNLKNVEECRRTVDEATKFLGGLDALVNNAGLTMPKDFYDIDEEHFNDIFNLNFRSYFFCSQQAIKHLIERGEKLAEFNKKDKWAGGSIVNISSETLVKKKDIKSFVSSIIIVSNNSIASGKENFLKKEYASFFFMFS